MFVWDGSWNTCVDHVGLNGTEFYLPQVLGLKVCYHASSITRNIMDSSCWQFHFFSFDLKGICLLTHFCIQSVVVSHTVLRFLCYEARGQKKLEERACLILTVYSPSSKEGRAGTQGMDQSRGHKVLLTGLLLQASSACFLRAPRTSRPGVALFTVSWTHINH